MNALIIQKDGTGLLSPETASNISAFEHMLKAVKEQYDELKARILQEMEENNIIKLETDKVVITYVAETTRESLDTKKLRADFPEVYDAYAKLSPVKASLRVKVK